MKSEGYRYSAITERRQIVTMRIQRDDSNPCAINTEKGDVISRVAAAGNGLECQRRSPFYIGGLWAVSAWAMVTNVTQGLLRKSRNGGAPLGKILWEMGRDPNHVSSSFFDRFSKYNRWAKYGAAGWQSLDLFYNYHEKTAPQLKEDMEGFLTRHWVEKMENRQAVTNRLKLVVEFLVRAFEKNRGESEIRLLSIASGSAQAVIEAMKKMPHLNVRALLIDMDVTAIGEAKRLTQEAGLAERFSFIHDSTQALEKAAADFCPHIIEMVGFLDYRPRQKAVELVKRIWEQLPEGGTFMTCNIRGNREKIFIDWVLLWPMIYRSESEFANILVRGGFSPEKIDLVYEPHRIHGIAFCQK